MRIDTVLAADGVTMDGTAVAFHKRQSRIVHPWKREAADANPAVGALFQARVFVRVRDLRELLLAFTRTGAARSCKVFTLEL